MTLADFMKYLEARGVFQDFASFVGAATAREHVIGLIDEQPAPRQPEQMRQYPRRGLIESARLAAHIAYVWLARTRYMFDPLAIVTGIRLKSSNDKRSWPVDREANLPYILGSLALRRQEVLWSGERQSAHSAGEKCWVRM